MDSATAEGTGEGTAEPAMSIAAANTRLRVPAGFRNLLEGLAREVLREQPSDIVAFAAEYFQRLLEQREELKEAKGTAGL